MGLAFVGFYPLAALLLRVFKVRYIIWVHAGLQVTAMLLMYVGLGLGIRLGQKSGELFNTLHTKLGLVISVSMLFQPLFGWLHHRGFLKTGGRTAWTYFHTNFGRTLILLGGLNGIFGRPNERDYPHGQTIFAALFGIVFGVYLVIWGITTWLRRRVLLTIAAQAEEKHSPSEILQIDSEPK
jgi:hypothetical protein